MNKVILISPNAVICDGLPLGSPEQAIQARPDLAFSIASAMLVYDRQQRAEEFVAQVSLLTSARNDALAASAALSESVAALQAQLNPPAQPAP